MGKFKPRSDVSRSKYLIIASCAAIAMVLGALSVGAQLNPKQPTNGLSHLSQVYPIPAKSNNHSDSGSTTQGGQSLPSLPNKSHASLSAVEDWGKKALLTNPINLQVRVGLTQAIAQVNAFGVSVALPLVVDTATNATNKPPQNDSNTTDSPDDTTVAPTSSTLAVPTPSDNNQITPTLEPNNILPPNNNQSSSPNNGLSVELEINITP